MDSLCLYNKEYNYRINPAIFSWFVENTDTLIIQGLARYDRSKLPAGNLYTFANQHLTSREFASYIERRGPMVVTDDPEFFIKQSIDARISDQIIKYEDSVLEKKIVLSSAASWRLGAFSLTASGRIGWVANRLELTESVDSNSDGNAEPMWKPSDNSGFIGALSLGLRYVFKP